MWLGHGAKRKLTTWQPWPSAIDYYGANAKRRSLLLRGKVDLLEQNTVGPVIMWWGWTFRNKKFRWTCHHVLRADLLEQKNSGGPVITWWGRTFWNKKFRWTCHHVMRADLPEQKIPVDLSSRDESGPFWTKNSGGPVIKQSGMKRLWRRRDACIHKSSLWIYKCRGVLRDI